MTRKKIAAVISGTVMLAAVIYAYAEGPDPRSTTAPGDTDPKNACARAGCHVGTALNGGGGKVVVNFANGLTYTPGVQQTLQIVVTDAVAKVYGFQMTARLQSNLSSGQAGDFTAGTQQFVLCDNGSLKTSKGCPATGPVQFIEHSAPFKSNTISVLWTPPSTNVGNVHIYVAANAANFNGDPSGDHIYAADYVLTPQVAAPPPTIAAVVSASAFSATAGLTPGTYLEIYGSNLAGTMRGWSGSDFNPNAPTSLDNVSVTIDGIPAFVAYVSSGQVNVLSPADPNTGPGMQIVLSYGGVASNAFTMAEAAVAPALLSPPNFNAQGHQWVVAQYPDLTYVGKTNLIGGLNFKPAKPGDVITIWGIGFGPVTPAFAPGVLVTKGNSLTNAVSFRFGQTPATLQYYGLAPSYTGLYQFNVVVPNVGAGDMPLNVDVGGVPIVQNLYITVSQ